MFLTGEGALESETRCVFCHGPLNGRETSEHVLLNAFGGRVTTRKLSCAPCNNQFGNTIDRELAEQFAAVRNMFEMVSGDGKDAPSLRKVQAGDRKVNLLGNGEITLAEKPFTVEEIGDGQFRVQINLRSLEELEKVIPHIVARTGISEERLREQLSGAQFTDTQERPGTVNFRFSFGGEEVMRAVGKACFLLWARKLGNEQAHRSEYDEARSFICNGGEDFLRTRTFLDSRPLLLGEQVEARYGPLFNVLYVTSDASGRVIGHFTVYNLIGFQIVLAEAGAAPSETARLANNPLDPKTWSDKATEVPEITIAWLDERRDELEEYRLRFVRMMEAYRAIMTKRAHTRIIDRVFAGHGLPENEAIPLDLLNSIAREIGARIVHNAMGIPLTMPVSQKDVAKALKRPQVE